LDARVTVVAMTKNKSRPSIVSRNFAHVTGDHTMFNGSVEHLTKASAVSPNTAMPNFNFKP
jgi:hypothetical protein